MANSATITVISGPDRGKMFELDTEQVSIGHGDGNDLHLSDQSLEDHQASIVCRDGRYAIFSPVDETVEVDGRLIPSGRWVWLPETARVRVSSRTAFQFNVKTAEAAAAAAQPAQATPPEKPPRKTKASKASRKSSNGPATAKPKRKRQTAKFITGQVGEPLVKLGEDGQLPDLQLYEGERAAQATKPGAEKGSSNSMVLYIAIGASFFMSIAMLFMDFEPSRGHSKSDLRSARAEIRQEFYGGENDDLQPYQLHLRAAQRAYSAGDSSEEMRNYRKVLDLLNSEGNSSSIHGLTGDKRQDDDLRRLIGILLAR